MSVILYTSPCSGCHDAGYCSECCTVFFSPPFMLGSKSFFPSCVGLPASISMSINNTDRKKLPIGVLASSTGCII